MKITGASAREFADKTMLPAISRGKGITAAPPPIKFDPQKDEAWVVGPQLFSFVEGVTAERREMIATSALFASLAADVASNQRESEAWNKAYVNALTKLGWVLQETTKRRFDQTNAGTKVHEAVIEFIAALGVGGTALTLVTAALNAMKKVSDDKPWITLFDRQTETDKFTGFQVGLADQKPDGAFQVRLLSFSLELTQSHTQVLFLDFNSLAVKMDSEGSTVTVAEDVLRDAMPNLKKRLGAYVANYVSEVELPPVH